jgi:hypothetical protein
LATWVSFTKRWAVWLKRGASRRGASHGTVGTTVFNLAQLLKAEAMEERALQVEQDAKEMAGPEALAKAAIREDCAKFKLSMRPSRVHRFGVFSEEPISAGEKVIEYTGERVSRSEAVRRCRKGLTYLYMLDSYRSIDGSAGGSGAELINHCREPNCRFHKEDGQRAADPCRRRVAARLQVPEDLRNGALLLRRPDLPWHDQRSVGQKYSFTPN